MNHINNDAVLWGVIACVVLSAVVVGWLLFVTWRNATKDQDKQ
jgi:hypothetical protein